MNSHVQNITDTLSSPASPLTRIVVLELALGSTYGDVLAAPRKLLDVWTVVGQRHRSPVVTLLALCHMSDAVKVLRTKPKKKSGRRYSDTSHSTPPHQPTWYSLGSANSCRMRLHSATEFRSSVHSVCNGSRFTFEQNGWMDRPLGMNDGRLIPCLRHYLYSGPHVSQLLYRNALISRGSLELFH